MSNLDWLTFEHFSSLGNFPVIANKVADSQQIKVIVECVI